jgi:CheY-like chemotaxis protein
VVVAWNMALPCSEGPDVLICDIAMPSEDNYQVMLIDSLVRERSKVTGE